MAGNEGIFFISNASNTERVYATFTTIFYPCFQYKNILLNFMNPMSFHILLKHSFSLFVFSIISNSIVDCIPLLPVNLLDKNFPSRRMDLGISGPC